MLKKIVVAVAFCAVAVVLLTGMPAGADEFTKEDLARWNEEYMSVVKKGRELWVSAELGTNGVACAQTT